MDLFFIEDLGIIREASGSGTMSSLQEVEALWQGMPVEDRIIYVKESKNLKNVTPIDALRRVCSVMKWADSHKGTNPCAGKMCLAKPEECLVKWAE
jgi:hypothetical protein